MAFTFDPNSPAANQAPSTSQPIIQQNFSSTSSILAVDHITFNNDNGGKHSKVTFNVQSSPSSPSNPEAVAYTNVGSADTNSALYYINASTTVLLSCVKAFGVFTGIPTNGAVTLANGYNVTSVTSSSFGQTYTIILNTSCTTGNNVVVFAMNNNAGSTLNWSFVGGTLTISNARPLQVISFIVLQA